jgi:DNA polymerase III delta prime subunit
MVTRLVTFLLVPFVSSSLMVFPRPENVKVGFKKPGKHGMNVFRAVMITGSPGIGKTTSAHLCAQLEGFTVIELNASDSRSKKLVEVIVGVSRLRKIH